MLMVPLYAVASFISLFSLEAAFFIDVVRDIYEVSLVYDSLFVGLTRSWLGIRHLLFLRSPHSISRRREVAIDPLAWTTTEISRIPNEPVLERSGRERSIHFLVPEARRYS